MSTCRSWLWGDPKRSYMCNVLLLDYLHQLFQHVLRLGHLRASSFLVMYLIKLIEHGTTNDPEKAVFIYFECDQTISILLFCQFCNT